MKVWKKIPNTNGFYFASNEGEVKSRSRMVVNNKDGGKRLLKCKVISPKTKSNGYMEVAVAYETQKRKMMYVHRCVYFAFNPQDIGKDGQINHIDGNKKNNKIENLELVSISENIRHAYRIGLRKGISRIGENSTSARLNNQQVLEIRRIFEETRDSKKLSEMFGICRPHIISIVKRRVWKHI